MVRKLETALGQPVKTRVVDDSHFRAAFDVQTTPLDEAAGATVAWHLSHSAN